MARVEGKVRMSVSAILKEVKSQSYDESAFLFNFYAENEGKSGKKKKKRPKKKKPHGAETVSESSTDSPAEPGISSESKVFVSSTTPAEPSVPVMTSADKQDVLGVKCDSIHDMEPNATTGKKKKSKRKKRNGAKKNEGGDGGSDEELDKLLADMALEHEATKARAEVHAQTAAKAKLDATMKYASTKVRFTTSGLDQPPKAINLSSRRLRRQRVESPHEDSQQAPSSSSAKMFTPSSSSSSSSSSFSRPSPAGFSFEFM